MKKSLSIFRIFFALFLVANVAIGAKALAEKDHSTVLSASFMTAFCLPTIGASCGTVRHGKNEWRKTGPVAFIVISAPATVKTKGYSDPTIDGIMPGNELNGNFGGLVGMGSAGMVKAPIDQIFGEFNIGRALSFQLIFGTTYVAATAVPLLPQYTNDALPTGVTFSSAEFSTFQKFVNFYCNIKALFNKLTITADDTANFDKALKVTHTKADGNLVSVSATWNRLSLNPADYVQTVRVINKRFVTGADIRYELADAVVPGSGTKTLTFVFEIERIANTFNFTHPTF